MPLRLSEQGWNGAPPGTLEYLAVRFLKNHTTKNTKISWQIRPDAVPTVC